MAKVIVEEALLREPNLWVPHKKPVGKVRVDYANSISDGLVAFTLLESLTPWIYGMERFAFGHNLATEVITQHGRGVATGQGDLAYVSLGPCNDLFPDNDKSTIVFIRNIIPTSPPTQLPAAATSPNE